jgi:hypothetical protein
MSHNNWKKIKIPITNQRQHLSAVKNCKLCGTTQAENGKFCGHVRQNFSNCAVFFAIDLMEFCEHCAINCAGRSLLARVINNATQ